MLSVCMIVKNESEYLEKCLSSVKAAADEIIVIDTGSEDNTVAIAERFTSRIFREPFTDFGSLRNRSLDLANCEWILVIDGDEILDKTAAEKLLHIKKSTPRKKAFKVCRQHYMPNGGWYTGWSTRLFPNDPGIRFSGEIFESLFLCNDLENSGYEVEETDILIHHLAYYRPLSRRIQKAVKYASMTKEVIKRLKEKTDSSLYVLYISQLLHLNEFKKALAECQKIPANEPDYLLLMGNIYRSQNLFEKAGEYYSQFIKLHNTNYATGWVYNYLGLCLLEQGKYEEALQHFKTAFRMRSNLLSVKVNIALTYRKLGEEETADRIIKTFLQKYPVLTEYLPANPSFTDSFNWLSDVHSSYYNFISGLKKDLNIYESICNHSNV